MLLAGLSTGSLLEWGGPILGLGFWIPAPRPVFSEWTGDAAPRDSQDPITYDRQGQRSYYLDQRSFVDMLIISKQEKAIPLWGERRAFYWADDCIV